MKDSLQFWANVAQILSLPISILALIFTGITWFFPTPTNMRHFIHRIRPLLSYIAFASFFLWLGTRIPAFISPSSGDLQATNTALQATINALQTSAAEEIKITETTVLAATTIAGDNQINVPPDRIASTTTAITTPTQSSAIITCQEWTLFNDFKTWPKPENPNSDSCGGIVWYFMSSSKLDRNTDTYYLLPNSTPGRTSEVGTVSWKNVDAVYAGITYDYKRNSKDKTIIVHTDDAKLLIIGWKSPMNGKVKMTGAIFDGDSGCGDGINWFIDKGSSELAAGTIDNGSAQDISRGFGGNNLNSIDVNQGDFIYFIFHPRDGSSCDTTYVDFSIAKI